MTDKVQKIREEVVRIHKLLPVMDGDNIYVNYADRICTTLEMYIDSMQEEPVSEDLESFANNIGVKEEIKIHIDDLETEIYVGMALKEAVKRAVKTGAQWMYEKMMKDAVEAEVQWHDGFLLIYDEHEVEDLLLPDIKVGDKVRLAVIKED